MSIKVSHLTKTFGKQKAVDDISFEVNQGEILGFLGPNGAGKSTTMKIATCYLPPTDGEVEVLGYDVVGQPRDVKRVIGYLPEHNPLYLDMYVKEYLNFIAGLHGLKGAIIEQNRSRVIELCGLEAEQHKLVGALSKGYRQRVGLAQALIHDPKVLILDEPTTGLDPNQIIEIRNLIRDVSAEKTVIFSTHIMQEVEALCERVVIINQGKIVANDKLQSLVDGKSSKSSIVVELATSVDATLFNQIDGVLQSEEITTATYRLEIDGGEDIRPLVSKFVLENDMELIGLRLEEGSIEDIFQQFTKENHA